MYPAVAAEASNSRHGISRMAEVGQVEEEACRVVVVVAAEEDCDARAVGCRNSDDMTTWSRWSLTEYER